MEAGKDWFISDVKREMDGRDPRGVKTRVVEKFYKSSIIFPGF